MFKYLRKISKEHIVLFSVAITIITLIIASLFNWDSNPITGLDKLTGDILITLFCLANIYILGIAGTAGFRKKGFKKGLICGVPFIIIGVCAAVIGNMGVDFTQLQPVPLSRMILFTVNMLLIGVNEEISMRSLILNNFILRYGKNRKGIYQSVLISSLIFGGIHLVNIFFMSPVTVIVQSINAASAGMLFAAIYICSKNIWAGILIHAIVDWLALFVGQCFIGGSSVISIQMTIPQGITMIGLGSLPPIIIAVIMINKGYKFT